MIDISKTKNIRCSENYIREADEIVLTTGRNFTDVFISLLVATSLLNNLENKSSSKN